MPQHTSVYAHAFMPARVRTALLAVVATVALVLGMSAPVAAAEQRAAGTLSGTVSDADGPLPFAFVSAENENDGAYVFAFNGSYTMSLDPGTYTVCASAPDHMYRCIDGVVVTSGGSTTQDILLERYGHITGTVTGLEDAPLDHAIVRAATFDDQYGEWTYYGFDRTEPDGSFDMNVPPGDYVVSFSGPNGQGYRTEYWENASTFDDATLVPVPDGGSVERDAQLTRTAGITGHVEFADGDNTYGMVSLYNAANQLRRTVRVHSDGTFAAWNLKPGTYKVAFNRLSGYAVSEAQIFIGKHEFAGLGAADSFVLGTDEHVDDVDAVLNPGGAITGLLQDTTGEPLSDCLVQAYAPNLVTRAAWTSDDGSFSVGGLSTGQYKLRVVDQPGNHDVCDGGDQWYVDADGQLSKVGADALPLSVTVGDTVDLANPLTYLRGARITGTVTLPDGAGRYDRMVYAVDLATHTLAGRTKVRADGTYDLHGLAGGTYRVTFNRVSGMAYAAAQFYDGKAEHLGHAAADEVNVGFGEVQTDISADLAAGGSISGKLVSLTGDDLRYCYVQAYTSDNSLVTRATYTERDGTFTIGGLTTGDYKVRVVQSSRTSKCNAGVQFYVGGDGHLVRTPGTAVGVAVTLGEDTQLPTDLVYSRAGVITGTVTLPAGADRFVDGNLRVVDATTGQVVRRVRSVNSDGTFKVGGLLPGSYRIAFNRVSGMAFAAAQFYDGKAESLGSASADVIELGSEESVVGIDATLVEGGSITGTLVDGDGNPLECEIQAFTKQNTLVTRTAYSDEDGTFSIGGLSTGDYFVRVLPDGFGCAEGRQYVAGNGGELVDTLADAEAVSVTIGDETALSPDLVYGADEPVVVITNSVKPSISGTAQVGQTLTAVNGTWTPADVAFAYQWRVDGADVTGADDPTYVPVAGDVGKKVTVRVTASRSGSASVSETSNPTADVVAAPLPDVVNNTAPSINGTAQVGSTLTAVNGTWTPADATFAYQWRVDGADVTGADDPTYVPVAADVGKTVTVRVTASKTGYNSASATSGPTAAVVTAPPGEAIANSAVPTISGTAQVGKSLTATSGTWTPGGLTYAYAWKVGGAPVAGVTGNTLVVPATAVGKTVTVTVTASKTGLTSSSATSATTSAVAPAVFTLSKAPSIKGKAKVGKKLKYKAGTISPSATTVTFQWLRNGKVIKKATASKYKLVTNDKGKNISLRVTYSRVGYTTLVGTTAQTGKVLL